MKPLILSRHSREGGNPVIIGLIALLAAGFPPLLFAAESLKLESYYPSPSGIFKSLRVSGDAFVATAGGNLGVGTASPQFKLDVQGSTQSARIGRVETGAWPQNTDYAYWGNENLNHNDAASPSYALLQGLLGDTHLNAAVNQSLYFRTKNQLKMIIEPDGDVGIGASAPNPENNTSFAPSLTIGDPSAAAGKFAAIELQGKSNGDTAVGTILFRNTTIAGDNTIAQITTLRDDANIGGRLLFKIRNAASGSLKNSIDFVTEGGFKLYQNNANGYYMFQAWQDSTGLYNFFSIDPDNTAPDEGDAFAVGKVGSDKFIRMGVFNLSLYSPKAKASGTYPLNVYASNDRVFAVRADGKIFSDAGITITSPVPADLAESFLASEKNLEPGDVVSFSRDLVKVDFNKKDTDSIDPEKLAGLEKTNKAHEKAVGVISTKPGVLLSGNLKNSQPLALAGRVPTKVSLENGPIEPGDHLAASSTPGHAMKATKPGHAVGIALEPFNDKKNKTGKIMVLIQPGWWPGDSQEQLANLRDENEKLKLRLDKLERRLAGVRP